MSSSPSGLRLDATSLSIGSRVLIHDLQLDLQPGQCWAVIGANGSGKSTLLRALAGFQPEWRARVQLDGRPLDRHDLLDLARRRAYLAQERSDVFGLSVMETLLLARHAHAAGLAWENSNDIARVEKTLALLDISHLVARDVRTLSGGERQRVALAAVWAQDCSLLLLDEPVNHLDLPHQLLLMKLLREACRQQQTVVIVVHDINLVTRCASHALLLMPDGSWQAGPVDQVFTTEHLQTCLGCPLQKIEYQGQHVWLPANETGPS